MKGYKPHTLGAELHNNARITALQARFVGVRTQKDHFLDSIPKPVEISLSSYSEGAKPEPQKRVDQRYHGLTLEDTEFFE